MEILSNIPGAEHGRAKRGWEEMERRCIGTSEASLNPFRFPRRVAWIFLLQVPVLLNGGKLVLTTGFLRVNLYTQISVLSWG